MTNFGALTPETMHRGAKLFMDRGDAATYDDALDTLRSFRIGIMVGDDAAASEGTQLALLTAVNVAARSFLGGVEVVRCPNGPLKTGVAAAPDLHGAVLALGGRLVDDVVLASPVLLIGDVAPPIGAKTVLRVTWQGWSGGVVPAASDIRLAETGNVHVAPILAAAIAVGEVFQALAGRTPYAASRTTGLSLWSPRSEWTDPAAAGENLLGLPAGLWLIGLGNLGQAFLWCLGALPYASPGEVRFVLQDNDELQPSNESTSVLSSAGWTGRKKTRAMAEWAEGLGFTTRIVERRFGSWNKWSEEAEDPAVALCGVDNARARMVLEEAGFPLVVEAGLGTGPHAYRNWASIASQGSGRPATSGCLRRTRPRRKIFPACPPTVRRVPQDWANAGSCNSPPARSECRLSG